MSPWTTRKTAKRIFMNGYLADKPENHAHATTGLVRLKRIASSSATSWHASRIWNASVRQWCRRQFETGPRRRRETGPGKVERLSLGVLALHIVDKGQIVHRTQCIGMLGTQHAALDLHGLAVERLTLRILALYVVNGGEIVHGSQRARMLETQHAAADLKG